MEKHLENISQILSGKHEITIVTEQYEPGLPLKESYPEAQVFRIPVGDSTEKGKKFVIWKWWAKHLSLIRDADVIHVHDVFFWLLPFRLFFPAKKFFITFHGYERPEGPGKSQLFWHKIGERLTNGNICIGDFHRRWYHIRPDIVSYGAVSVRPTAKKQPAKQIVYLGRLAPDTGIAGYLSALRGTDFRIDIFGSGPLQTQLEEYCLKNKIKARFFGFVPHADSRLSGYRIAFTSGYLSILEALLAKIPVVAYYITPMKRDYLTLAPFAGFIGICSRPEEVRKVVEHIFSAPDRYQTRLDRGYNWAKAQTWAKLAKQYENLWTKDRSKQP